MNIAYAYINPLHYEDLRLGDRVFIVSAREESTSQLKRAIGNYVTIEFIELCKPDKDFLETFDDNHVCRSCNRRNHIFYGRNEVTRDYMHLCGSVLFDNKGRLIT